MTRTLLICPWFGPLPEWWGRYIEQRHMLLDQGYDMLIDTDLDGFKRRVRDVLDIECPITFGSSKVHDYRATFGLLYEQEIRGYDWWGHTDFDCVYGRINQFVTGDKLEACDIYTDCQYNYISGPFSLYRAGQSRINEMFKRHGCWDMILADPVTHGWVETAFTEIAQRTVRVMIENHHGFSEPHLLKRDGDRLLLHGREISHYHFNRTKRWPL